MSEIYLIDQDDNRLYLSGPGTPYDGSGTPWGLPGTSPYKLSMNDVTGSIYTPQAPAPVPTLAGSPPFTVGSELLGVGYGNVEEPVGIQCYATTHANAVALKQQLMLVLLQSRRPPILAVQPDGASSPAYFELGVSRLQETMHFINQEAAASPQLVRLAGTWQRSPFGGRLSGETILNAVSMSNQASGSPSNLVSLGSAGAGELVTQGSPLNLTLWPADAVAHGPWLLATVSERSFTSRSDSMVTNSATGVLVATISQSYTALLTARTRPRVLLRTTSPSANLELRVLVLDTAGVLYTSPWVLAQAGGGAAASILDMGGWRDRLSDTDITTGNYSIRVEMRSTNGSNTSGTLAGVEFLGCHTFCRVDGSGSSSTPARRVRVLTFRARPGRPALPMAPFAFTALGTDGSLDQVRPIRGRPPVYVRGASLWGVYLGTSAPSFTPAATWTVTATHAPLYQTLRGNG